MVRAFMGAIMTLLIAIFAIGSACSSPGWIESVDQRAAQIEAGAK